MPFIPLIVSGKPETVTVSGETIEHGSGGGGAYAGVRFNLDGTIDKREGGTYSQIDTATDWVRPESVYAGTYHLRWTQTSGSVGVSPFAAGVWTAMSGGPHEWYEVEVGGSIDSCSITIDVSDDGGTTTLDSGLFQLTADDTP